MNVLLNEDEKKLYYPKPDTFLMKSQLKMDKKLLVDKSSVDVNIRRLIQTIPKYRYHFQIIEKEIPVVIEGTKASPTGSKASPDWSKGSPDRTKASPTDWTSIQQNDIGISTTLLLHLQKRWEQDHVSFLTHIMDIHSYLLQSIDKLLEKKIVHNAIQEENILYSEQIEAPILVHFLESYIISDLVGGGSDENLKDLEEESSEEESGEEESDEESGEEELGEEESGEESGEEESGEEESGEESGEEESGEEESGEEESGEEESGEEESGEEESESGEEPSTEKKIPETWDKTCLHNCILKCMEQIILNPNEDEKKFTDFLKKYADENKFRNAQKGKVRKTYGFLI